MKAFILVKTFHESSTIFIAQLMISTWHCMNYCQRLIGAVLRAVSAANMQLILIFTNWQHMRCNNNLNAFSSNFLIL